MDYSEGVGIKVTTFPGEVRGCVINHVEEHMESTGLLTGDRFALFRSIVLINVIL